MILTIGFTLLLIVSITMIELNFEYWEFEVIEILSYLFAIFSLIAILSCYTLILIVQIPRSVNYEITQYERTQLIAEYEKGNEYAYDSIIEFDKQLLSIKKWANNPFTSWFYNQRIANEVDFILYEDYDFEIGGN